MYKARLVAQSFSPVYGINYTEIFVFAIKQELLRIFLAIIIILEMILLQIDIIDTYLESSLNQNN